MMATIVALLSLIVVAGRRRRSSSHIIGRRSSSLGVAYYWASIVALSSSVVVAGDYTDRSPATIRAADLAIVKKFEELSYEMADRPIEIDAQKIRRVVDYILEHKAYSIERNLLKIELAASAGYKSNTAYDTPDNFADELQGRPYYRAGVLFRYPILDEKENKDIKKTKIQFEQKVVDVVGGYFDKLAEFRSARRYLKFLRLKQRREKVRQHAGIVSLDSRIDLMEKILKTQDDIIKKRTELSSLREEIVSFVTRPKRKKLAEMLK